MIGRIRPALLPAGLVASLLLALLASPPPRVADGLIEEDRLEEYGRRGHGWPPNRSEYVPGTDGWRRIWERRFRQIEQMDDPGGEDKYNGYVSSVHAALLCPNFTENGWGLTRAPTYIVDELKRRLHEGLANDPEEETPGHGVEGANMPLFVDVMDYSREVLDALRPLHEAWSGVELVGTTSFGLRVYRNASNLNMHVDQPTSHIISSIMHVDHDPDSDPWPIIIEDYQGNLNEVVLESGDMLLYESSKCMHGRPTNFSGSWYSSLFTHYAPVGWDGDRRFMDVHYRIPPIWHRILRIDDRLEELKVFETSFYEPGCENNWCGLKDSVKWWGPAEAVGKVLSTGGVNTTLDLPKNWLDRKNEL